MRSAGAFRHLPVLYRPDFQDRLISPTRRDAVALPSGGRSRSRGPVPGLPAPGIGISGRAEAGPWRCSKNFIRSSCGRPDWPLPFSDKPFLELYVRAPARDQEADILACARHVRLGGCERRQTSLSELFRQPHTSCAISAPETSTLPVRAHRADLFFESKASGVARSGSSACRKPDAGAVPEASEGRSCLGTWYACADASACRATPARGRPAISRWRPPSAPYLETLCHDNHEEFHEELTTRRRRS